MKYESSIFNGLKVMTKVKVFVQAANADADAHATVGLWHQLLEHSSQLAKKSGGAKTEGFRSYHSKCAIYRIGWRYQ